MNRITERKDGPCKYVDDCICLDINYVHFPGLWDNVYSTLYYSTSPFNQTM